MLLHELPLQELLILVLVNLHSDLRFWWVLYTALICCSNAHNKGPSSFFGAAWEHACHGDIWVCKAEKPMYTRLDMQGLLFAVVALLLRGLLSDIFSRVSIYDNLKQLSLTESGILSPISTYPPTDFRVALVGKTLGGLEWGWALDNFEYGF